MRERPFRNRLRERARHRRLREPDHDDGLAGSPETEEGLEDDDFEATLQDLEEHLDEEAEPAPASFSGAEGRSPVPEGAGIGAAQPSPGARPSGWTSGRPRRERPGLGRLLGLLGELQQRPGGAGRLAEKDEKVIERQKRQMMILREAWRASFGILPRPARIPQPAASDTPAKLEGAAPAAGTGPKTGPESTGGTGQ